MEENTRTLADYLDILNRRKYHIAVTALLIAIVSVLVAYNLPRTYRSTATMLIEAPIPANLIPLTRTDYAEQQLSSISKRVLTTDTILSIISEANLYDGALGQVSNDRLVSYFKKDAEIALVESQLGGSPTASGSSEVAFTISFTYEDAVKAQEIASRLASLFIEENDRNRTQRVARATDFLQDESVKLNSEIEDIDNRIARFKEQYGDILPESLQLNLAAIDRTESDLRDTDNQIRTVKERITFLTAELARAQATLPVTPDQNAPMSKEDQLRSLQAQYIRLTSKYQPSHPDVIRIKRQLEILDPLLAEQPSGANVRKELEAAKARLNVLQKKYAANHPDIAKQKAQVDSLQQKLAKAAPAVTQIETSSKGLTNPAFYAVEAQLRSSQTELQGLLEKKELLKDKLERLHIRVSQVPQLEKEYSDLARERDNSIKKYNQLKEKLLDAKLAQTLEETQHGQTLTILEQPTVPSEPEKGIRRKVAMIGAFLGVAAGVGLALLLEFLDPGVKGYRALMGVTGLMPLVVIPYMESPAEVEQRLTRHRRRKQYVIWASIGFIVLALILLFVYFVYPQRP